MNVAAFNFFVIFCMNATTQYLPFEVSLVYSIEFASNQIFCLTLFLSASVQSVDVLLDGPPHPDLIDDVRGFFRGHTVEKILKQMMTNVS